MRAPLRLAGELLQLRPTRARASCPTSVAKAPLRSRPCNCFHTSATRRAGPRPDAKGPWFSWSRPRSNAAILLAASGGIFTLAAGLSNPQRPDKQTDHESGGDQSGQPETDQRDPDVPRFRLSQVREHDEHSGRPWVTRGDKVYDITEWIDAHPGGDVILRAAGGSIDPYWDIFAIHKASHVHDILEQYFIGYVDWADLVNGEPSPEAIEDPFKDDPVRDPRLVTLTAKPRNAETPNEELGQTFTTPNELFYVRNHMWVPKVEDPKDHVLTIELLDGTEKEYTLEDLKARFKPVKIAAVLQCSGNRRKDMTLHAADTQGLQWNVGAISCAVWEGVKLADVLSDAGFPLAQAREGDTEARHVQFSGLESYGASIPLGPVLDPRGDVILAYSMNGEPLPRDHGFPLRALVPGYVAARSVKWLKRVVVSEEESQSQWQQRDYKLFGPNVTRPDWTKAPAIQEMPITSAITSVKLGEWAAPRSVAQEHTGTQDVDQAEAKKANTVGPSSTTPASWGRRADLSGYAYSGGGRRIIRVDVSLDGGKTWDQAELIQDSQAPGPDLESQGYGHKSWAWQRWRYDGVIPLEGREAGVDGGGAGGGGDGRGEQGGKRCSTLLVKATDEAYNSQPDAHTGIWNHRGNLANAWHQLKVCSTCQGGELHDEIKPK